MKTEADIQKRASLVSSQSPQVVGSGKKQRKESADCLLVGAKGLLKVESRRSVSFGLGVPLPGFERQRLLIKEVTDAGQSC